MQVEKCWIFSKISTSPSGQVSSKSTCPEAKFTCHGRADELTYSLWVWNPFHVQYRTDKYDCAITVAPYEQSHRHPHNPLKKHSRIQKASHHVNVPPHVTSAFPLTFKFNKVPNGMHTLTHRMGQQPFSALWRVTRREQDASSKTS